MGTDFNILLIEDNDFDADLIMRAFRRYQSESQITRLEGGQEAMDYFFPESVEDHNAGIPLPKLILLDIKLPGIDGMQVLRALKENQKTKQIPVVMLTSSTEERDIKRCYQLGANSFIPKPVEYENFQETMRLLGMYWLLMNQTPPLCLE